MGGRAPHETAAAHVRTSTASRLLRRASIRGRAPTRQHVVRFRTSTASCPSATPPPIRGRVLIRRARSHESARRAFSYELDFSNEHRVRLSATAPPFEGAAPIRGRVLIRGRAPTSQHVVHFSNEHRVRLSATAFPFEGAAPIRGRVLTRGRAPTSQHAVHFRNEHRVLPVRQRRRPNSTARAPTRARCHETARGAFSNEHRVLSAVPPPFAGALPRDSASCSSSFRDVLLAAREDREDEERGPRRCAEARVASGEREDRGA